MSTFNGRGVDSAKYQLDAVVLAAYHNNATDFKNVEVFQTDPGLRVFQQKKHYNQDAKIPLKPFMDPIADGAYTPVVDRSAEKRAVKGRVTNLTAKTEKKEVILTPFVNRCMTEFLELLIPTPHVGHPKYQEVVYEKQSRPNQRRILEEAESSSFDMNAEVKSFVKKEAYAKVTDPRIISTIDGRTKLLYSAFMYSFSEHLKQFDWYAFGKTPVEVARRVADIAHSASFNIVMSDLSRMDGNVCWLLRHLEMMALSRYFAILYHHYITELYANTHEKWARTTLCVWYQTFASRLSGEPGTSSMNTMDTAFISYLGKRMTKNPLTGTFYTPQEAWLSLGCYGGDDGITSDIDPEVLARAAAWVGQTMTQETTPRGTFGVNFLSRYYGPEVWWGDPNSCSDIRRQIVKFHTTVGQVRPLTKLVQKAMSYSLTDRYTPILGPLCQKVIDLLGADEASAPHNWWAKFDISVQFPNQYREWMDTFAREQMPDFDWNTFQNWLDELSLSTVLSPPLCWSSPVPEDSDVTLVVLGEEHLTGPAEEPLTEDKPKLAGQKPTRRRPTSTLGKPRRRNHGKKTSKKGRVSK